MDFKEHFSNSPHVYEDATDDLELEYPKLSEFLKLWQNPQAVDKTVKIIDDLKEVSDMAHKNMVKLLDRGENIEVLAAKSAGLNLTVVEFEKKAKKVNKGSFCKMC